MHEARERHCGVEVERINTAGSAGQIAGDDRRVYIR
jgi:hypothetical protein